MIVRVSRLLSSLSLFPAIAAAGLFLGVAPGCAPDDIVSTASTDGIDLCPIDEVCEDLPSCGDGVCGFGEDCLHCPLDCGTCFDPNLINVPGQPVLESMSDLYARARALGVSPMVAGIPNVEAFLARRSSHSSFAYPTGASSLQDFMTKLFQGGSWSDPGTGQTATPLPDANGCQLTHIDATYHPEDLVAFEGGNSLLYPGALIQGAYVNLGLGSLNQIHVPYTQRNPVSLVASLNEARTAPTATSSDVFSAIGDMIRQANIDGNVGQSKVAFDVVTASTLLEAATKLKFDVHVLGATVGATFDNTTTSKTNTVFVYYLQSLFSVSQDLKGFMPTVAELNSSTMAVGDLENLGAMGELAYNNLPTYIYTVTYGRMMLFSITSNVSTSDLVASANAVFGKNSASATQSQKETIQNSEMRLFGYGGLGDPQVAAIKSGNWQDYFSLANTPLSSLKPIAYEVHRFDDQLAVMSRTTSYDQRTCPGTARRITVQLSNTYKAGTLSVQSGGPWQQVIQTSNGFAQVDINSYLDNNDAQIKVAAEVGSTDIFNPSHAHLTLTIFVDGVQRTQVSWSCSSCHSRDPVWVYRVNQYTGEVTLVQGP